MVPIGDGNRLRITIMLTIFIPLMIALLITVFIPTSIMLFSSPIQQSIYRNMKLQNEQIFVRNLLSQEQRILEKQLQNFENVRNSLVPIFLDGPTQYYQSYNYSIVNVTPSAGVASTTQQSMWLSSGNATNVADLNADQQVTFSNYQRLEPFNQALLPDLNPTISSVVWTFVNGLVFVFPAVPNNLTSQSSIYNAQHNLTMQNYQLYQQNYTVLPNSSGVVSICSVVVNASLMGTVCFVYNGTFFFMENFRKSIIPQTPYLNTVLVTTMCTPDQQIPNRVLSFYPSNSSIKFYTNTSLVPPTYEYQIEISGFQPFWYQNTSGNMQLVMMGTLTYYQSPIMIWTYQSKIALFMYIIGSDEVLQNIQSDFNQNHLLPIILAPSLLFLGSCLVSWYVLSLIVGRLQRGVNVLLEKSNLIIKGDLEIEIPAYEGSHELMEVYNKLKILNELTKYCHDTYFEGNNSEKSIKYYRALGFFTELKKPKSVACIHQNLAGLCYDQKEYAKSLKYYKACLEETEESMLSNYKQFKTIKDLYIYVRSKHKKLPSDLRDQEIILIRRYSSLINTMFLCAKESEYPQLIEHMQTLLLILKDRPMDHRYIRTVLKMTDLTIRRGDYHQAWEHLVYCERLISDYDDLYNTQLRLQNSKTVEKRPQDASQEEEFKCPAGLNYPPETLYQYMLLLRGLYHESQQEAYEALQCYKDSFDGDCYNPHVREKIQEALKRLLVSENLFSKEIKESVYFISVDETTPKEYIFVVDFSTSMKNTMEDRDQQRQNFAIDEILRIYDNDIRDGDRVSVVKFSSSMEVVFNLMEKCRYKEMLRQTIEGLKREVPDGHTALFSTLKIVLATIQNLKRPKVLLILVDGPDNCSKVRMSEIQVMIEEISNLKLLIMGIELDEETEEAYHQLVENHCQGYVVDAADKDYINRIIKTKKHSRNHIETFIC